MKPADSKNVKNSKNHHAMAYAEFWIQCATVSANWKYITIQRHGTQFWCFCSIRKHYVNGKKPGKIPKPGKNSEFLNNWRPTSQLPTLSKCYEKLIDIKIRAFCTHNKFVDNHHFGFQPGCSTHHAIAKIVTDISNEERPTLATLIDLQSAFDVI